MSVLPVFPDLQGACVFITGGGSGIGACLTDGFLAQGAKVAFVQRSDASEFVEEMEEKHGHAPLFIPCDITDNTALRAAHVEKQCLKETLGPEDIVAGTLFLASDAARMMTGQVMPIDGGVVTTG